MNRRIEHTDFIALLFMVELLEPIHREEITIQWLIDSTFIGVSRSRLLGARCHPSLQAGRSSVEEF